MKRSTHDIFYSETTEQTAQFAKALSHPVRLAILKYINNKSCCYNGDLMEIIPLAQSTISQHLKELKSAGLIIGEIEAPKVRYCIDKENWRKAKKMFEMVFKKDFTNISCC
jgi:DNA-binding transcriptional ArsR family regulator